MNGQGTQEPSHKIKQRNSRNQDAEPTEEGNKSTDHNRSLVVQPSRYTATGARSFSPTTTGNPDMIELLTQT